MTQVISKLQTNLKETAKHNPFKKVVVSFVSGLSKATHGFIFTITGGIIFVCMVLLLELANGGNRTLNLLTHVHKKIQNYNSYLKSSETFIQQQLDIPLSLENSKQLSKQLQEQYMKVLLDGKKAKADDLIKLKQLWQLETACKQFSDTSMIPMKSNPSLSVKSRLKELAKKESSHE